MRDIAGSAAAHAARYKNLRRGSFTAFPPPGVQNTYIGIRKHQMTSVELLRDAQAEDRTLTRR